MKKIYINAGFKSTEFEDRHPLPYLPVPDMKPVSCQYRKQCDTGIDTDDGKGGKGKQTSDP
jgi:hypothetical protein